MQMDQQALRELLEFLSGSDIQELKLEGDDFRLEVRRNLPAPAAVVMPASAVAPPAAATVIPDAVAPAATSIFASKPLLRSSLVVKPAASSSRARPQALFWPWAVSTCATRAARGGHLHSPCCAVRGAEGVGQV